MRVRELCTDQKMLNKKLLNISAHSIHVLDTAPYMLNQLHDLHAERLLNSIEGNTSVMHLMAPVLSLFNY